MAFTKMKLTTLGNTIESKMHQGKVVNFTRVAIGDGLLGNGSMVNRTSLISERHSMKIDGILSSDNSKQNAVIATMDNREFTEGFPYRELALMAEDPDTGEEGTFLYDNAGQECEFLGTPEDGTIIYERIKTLIRVEQTDSFTFEASGNPVYLTAEDLETLLKDKADLGEDGKVVADQLPEMDYAATKHAAQHASSGDDPITPASIGAQATVTGGASTITSSNLTASRALVSDGNGKVSVSSITSTILGYLSGLTSNIQTQLNAKAASSHNHAAGNITSGTLPVARGGTGVTSLSALLGSLFASYGVPTYIPGFGAGYESRAYCTPEELFSAVGGGKIATGSYTGTGTYGNNNPTTLTFSFAPSILAIFNNIGIIITDSNSDMPMIGCTLPLTTTFTEGLFHSIYPSSGSYMYANVSSDRKTINWYSGTSAATQMNTANAVYFYLAIG